MTSLLHDVTTSWYGIPRSGSPPHLGVYALTARTHTRTHAHTHARTRTRTHTHTLNNIIVIGDMLDFLILKASDFFPFMLLLDANSYGPQAESAMV